MYMSMGMIDQHSKIKIKINLSFLLQSFYNIV